MLTSTARRERVTGRDRKQPHAPQPYWLTVFTTVIFTWLKQQRKRKEINLSIFIMIWACQTLAITCTHKHTPTALWVTVQSFSNYQLHTDAGMNTNTYFCSAGHESMAHCDSCRCGDGNFNEVSTAVVVSSPFPVRGEWHFIQTAQKWTSDFIRDRGKNSRQPLP